MSAIPLARNPRHAAICAGRSRKPGEGLREDKGEALTERSNDAL
jgi:hypothetical protein